MRLVKKQYVRVAVLAEVPVNVHGAQTGRIKMVRLKIQAVQWCRPELYTAFAEYFVQRSGSVWRIGDSVVLKLSPHGKKDFDEHAVSVTAEELTGWFKSQRKPAK